MALVAGHRRVTAFKRVFRCSMFLHAECGGFPVIFRVARCAFAAVRARAELPAMRVLVTIHALAVRHRGLEITARVAIAASHGLVLSEERKFCLRVIETPQLRHARPARRRVAALAGPGEAALVRIGVAPGTFLE